MDSPKGLSDKASQFNRVGLIRFGRSVVAHHLTQITPAAWGPYINPVSFNHPSLTVGRGLEDRPVPFTHHNKATMAVETIYRSSRDPESIFMGKNEADTHDRMLELAEQVTRVLEKQFTDLSDKQAEDIGIYLSQNRALLAKAFKGDASLLSQLLEAPALS